MFDELDLSPEEIAALFDEEPQPLGGEGASAPVADMGTTPFMPSPEEFAGSIGVSPPALMSLNGAEPVMMDSVPEPAAPTPAAPPQAPIDAQGLRENVDAAATAAEQAGPGAIRPTLPARNSAQVSQQDLVGAGELFSFDSNGRVIPGGLVGTPRPPPRSGRSGGAFRVEMTQTASGPVPQSIQEAQANAAARLQSVISQGMDLKAEVTDDLLIEQEALSDDLATLQARIESVTQAAADRAAQETAELEEAIESLRTSHVDPNRMWGSMSEGARFSAGIGVAVSMMGASIQRLVGGGGGAGQALQVIDAAIERDIQSQRAAIEVAGQVVNAQTNLLGELRTQYNDETQALESLRALRIGQARNALAEHSLRTTDPLARQAIEEAAAELELRQANAAAEAAKASISATSRRVFRTNDVNGLRRAVAQAAGQNRRAGQAMRARRQMSAGRERAAVSQAASRARPQTPGQARGAARNGQFEAFVFAGVDGNPIISSEEDRIQSIQQVGQQLISEGYPAGSFRVVRQGNGQLLVIPSGAELEELSAQQMETAQRGQAGNRRIGAYNVSNDALSQYAATFGKEATNELRKDLQTVSTILPMYRRVLQVARNTNWGDPVAKAEMGALISRLQIQEAQRMGLGALAGPDLDILQQFIANPGDYTDFGLSETRLMAALEFVIRDAEDLVTSVGAVPAAGREDAGIEGIVGGVSTGEALDADAPARTASEDRPARPQSFQETMEEANRFPDFIESGIEAISDFFGGDD